jgi:uncharacterized protein YjfI (DUF2170 family)
MNMMKKQRTRVMTCSIESLKILAESQSDWVVEQEGDCLSLSNDEGIDAFAYVGEQQIIIESALFAADSVDDTAALNDLILRTHQLLSLTAISIKQIDGQDYYIAFGALSSDSKDSVIIQEIETLFSNINDFLDLYSEHLKQESIA